MFAIPALESLRKKDHSELEASLCYTLYELTVSLLTQQKLVLKYHHTKRYGDICVKSSGLRRLSKGEEYRFVSTWAV